MRRAVLFLLLLLPSAEFAGRHADMPQFGRWIHDDSIYFVSAKSLAEGQGYRILSYPGQPFQTKYPPLYPLLLAGIWKWNPNFPENLALGTLVSWLSIPVLLLLCYKLFLVYGFKEKHAWAMTALLAVNPYLAIFGASMLTELPFTCLLIICLLLCRRAAQAGAPAWWAALAGATGGMAYLTRTTGLMLLVSGVACFLWRKQRSQAVWFAAAMLPFTACWSLWTRLHMVHGADPVTLYYTTYLDYHLHLVKIADLPVLLWKNFDQWLWGMGALIFPEAIDSLAVKILTQTLGVGMLVGVVRLARRTAALDYAVYAALSSVMLVGWHYPPTARLLAPIYPLLLAGFWVEMQRLAGLLGAALRGHDRGERAAAALMSVVLVGVLAGAAWMQFEVRCRSLPRQMQEWRKQVAVDEAAFAWIRANLPAGAQFLTCNDPVLFLYTGHRAASLTVPSLHWYHGDRGAVERAYAGLGQFARMHQLEYAYFTDFDFHRDLDDQLRQRVLVLLRHSPALETLKQFNSAALYRVR